MRLTRDTFHASFTRYVIICSLLLIFAGCSPQDRITQTSTIDALLTGAYDGQVPCRQLSTYGDFGIGTFDKLDGEMAVLDGKMYQIKSDGKVYRPDLAIKTPFASVCSFKPEYEKSVKNMNFKTFEAMLGEDNPNPNLFLAVKITGTFKHIKVRSVPAQTKPYPPLVEVAKVQPVFEMNDIPGTIIGFRTPPFVKGINVTGCHFHFLSKDLTKGGHVLDFEIKDAKYQIDKCNELLLILPEDDTLKNIDLSKDKSLELQKVEK